MSSWVNHLPQRLGVISRLFLCLQWHTKKGPIALHFFLYRTNRQTHLSQVLQPHAVTSKFTCCSLRSAEIKKRSLYLYHSAISFLGIFSSGKAKKIRRKCALLFGFLRRRRGGRWTEVNDARFFQLILFGYVFHEHALFVERHFDAFFRC